MLHSIFTGLNSCPAIISKSRLWIIYKCQYKENRIHTAWNTLSLTGQSYLKILYVINIKVIFYFAHSSWTAATCNILIMQYSESEFICNSLPISVYKYILPYYAKINWVIFIMTGSDNWWKSVLSVCFFKQRKFDENTLFENRWENFHQYPPQWIITSSKGMERFVGLDTFN